jgi:hypothetical protein
MNNDFEDAVQDAAEWKAKCRALEAEMSDLYTTMMAAAVEIQEQWPAHCDSEGYGPVNLMHRLECGIASQYGYDAGTLVRLESEIVKLRAELAALRERGVEVPEGWTLMPNGSKSMRISHCGVGVSFNEDEPDRRIMWLVDFLRALYAAPVAKPQMVMPDSTPGDSHE